MEDLFPFWPFASVACSAVSVMGVKRDGLDFLERHVLFLLGNEANDTSGSGLGDNRRQPCVGVDEGAVFFTLVGASKPGMTA
jgi:hypothetical protein